MKIYLPQDMDPAGKNYLLERGYELTVGDGNGDSRETMLKRLPEFDGVIIRTQKADREFIEAGKNLKVIARHGVGVDNIDLEAAREKGIRVTNGPESNCESVAEHTVALMMAAGRLLPQLNAAVRDGDWTMRNRIRLTDLKGKTVGMIGSGKIARGAARRLVYGFDAKVITWGTRHPESLPEYMTYEPDLEKLVRESDFVSLHCPSTPETRNLINRKILMQMKPTAFLINTARGDVVNEEDLYEALKNGVIKGAATDVFAKEPADANLKLLSLPNYMCTPHCASHTNESFANMALHAAIGADEVLSGKEITWPVV